MKGTRPVVLVTGASFGVGNWAAAALAGAWSRMIGASRDISRVTPRAGMTYLDVASDESVSAVVERLIDRFGRIDILVNNAGLGDNGAQMRSPSPRRSVSSPSMSSGSCG